MFCQLQKGNEAIPSQPPPRNVMPVGCGLLPYSCFYPIWGLNFVAGCRALAVHKLTSGMIKAAFPHAFATAFAIMVSDNTECLCLCQRWYNTAAHQSKNKLICRQIKVLEKAWSYLLFYRSSYLHCYLVPVLFVKFEMEDYCAGLRSSHLSWAVRSMFSCYCIFVWFFGWMSLRKDKHKSEIIFS